MAGYSLSGADDRDLDALYEYSILTFGPLTADRYFDELIARLERLAANPELGRD